MNLLDIILLRTGMQFMTQNYLFLAHQFENISDVKLYIITTCITHAIEEQVKKILETWRMKNL